MSVRESGMMSFDFLAGFTIFIISLVMVISMLPGIFIGPSSISIDYDAVAYRSGVILAEDPGDPDNPSWELPSVQKEDINRFGLAVSKDTPLILSSSKIKDFYDTDLFTCPDDYLQRIFFGEIPYSFNISLSYGDQIKMMGGEYPKSYGYIRRVILVKDIPEVLLDAAAHTEFNATEIDDQPSGSFKVSLDSQVLLDPSISPAYRYDPTSEPVWINITNIETYLNSTDTNPSPLAIGDSTSAELESIRFYRNNAASPVPFDYEILNPKKYRLFIDGTETTLVTGAGEGLVSSNITLLINPGYLPADQRSLIDVVYEFSGEADDILIFGNMVASYDGTDPIAPELIPGVIEVAVW